jgi:hypothetical protein
MHLMKEDRRQDHGRYQSMSGLSDDDLANQIECASIGSGERAGQRSPKLNHAQKSLPSSSP